jgi:hypothetical protein
LLLNCSAQSCHPKLSASPPEIDVGCVLVNNLAVKELFIYNDSLSNEPVVVKCENSSGQSVEGIVDDPEIVVYAKSHCNVKLQFQVQLTGYQVFSIYAVSKLTGTRFDLCKIRGTGVHAIMQVNDVTSIGRSKGGLWKSLSIDALNDILASKADPQELSTIHMDLGSCYIGEAGHIIRFLFNNPGLVPAKWHIYPSIESFADVEVEKSLSITPSVLNSSFSFFVFILSLFFM